MKTKPDVMKYFIGLLFVLFSTVAFAQLDGPESNKEGKHIGRETNSFGNSSMGGAKYIGRGMFSNNTDTKNFLFQPKEISLDVSKNEKINISQENEYMTKTMKFQPDYVKQNEGKMNEAFTKPQDFGSFSTDAEYLIISWRDAQAVDGDRVDILVNGEVIAHNVTLLSSYHSIKIKLKKGFTKVEFVALNQGQSGPNTADFRIDTEKGNMTHDQWNLATGVKAHLLVIKN